jgi:hypothetical protein
MAGVDLRTVAELMGHSSIQMTMRYAHLAPQHNRAAVDRLVPAKTGNRGPRRGSVTANGEDELVTKSVTGANVSLDEKARSRSNKFNIKDLSSVAP